MTKDFRLCDEEKKRIFYSRDVVFNESNSSRNLINSIKNEEVVRKSAVETECQQNDKVDDVAPETRNRKPKRPRRERKTPDQYSEWIFVAQEDPDPKSIEEAFSSVDKDDWLKAMKKKIDQLHKNYEWDSVELLKGRKAIKANGYSNANIMQMEKYNNIKQVWWHKVILRNVEVTTKKLSFQS